MALYTRSVESIKRGLQVQREDEAVDTVLHRYLKLYSERIAVLGEHRKHRASIVATATLAGAQAGQAFSFDDAELERAAPPPAAPADEWRRPFWLMRTLRASMAGGGYLSADGRVYVPRRVAAEGRALRRARREARVRRVLVNELRCSAPSTARTRSSCSASRRRRARCSARCRTRSRGRCRTCPTRATRGKAAAAADASAVAKLSSG